MAGFAKKERQRIIDGYLVATGRNMFHAGGFIDWLEEQPDHEAYGWFFGKDEAAAAREYRIGLARQMASGLRIVARVSEAPSEGSVVSLTVREFPAYHSPMDGRRGGGGYVRTDPEDAAHIAELQRQGIVSLKSWLNRYGSAFGEAASPIYDLVEAAEQERAARTA